MRIRVIYHDRCFDGAASAALLSRFLQDHYSCGEALAYQGVSHTPNFQWDPNLFDGEENAIVDFRYSCDPRITWWFDHHQSAFLSPGDERHYEQTRTSQKLLDRSEASCTSLIAGHLKHQYEYVAPELDELVRWADVIDGAKYATPGAAVEMEHPAARLRLVIENAKDPSIRDFVVRSMRFQPMEEILRAPQVQRLEDGLRKDQLSLMDVLSKMIERHGRIAVLDLTGTQMERSNKLMPYAIFKEIDYAVSILRIGNLIKVSLGTNPWSDRSSFANLATLAERYGGGGHSAVAGIALAPDQLSRARQIVEEIVTELEANERPADPRLMDRSNGLPIKVK